MHEFWNDYVKPKFMLKLCYMYRDSVIYREIALYIVYIKARHLCRYCKRC